MARTPVPTPIFRISHLANLRTFMLRGAVHAPSCAPLDGLAYRAIHDAEVQSARSGRSVPCGPGGVLLDYVPFYFATRSPMLLRIATGWELPVATDQREIIYLVSDVQHVVASGLRFVIYDGHALASLSLASSELNALERIDWDVVAASQWNNTPEDRDRKRRKQAEFLVHRVIPWTLVTEIGVLNSAAHARVEALLAEFPEHSRPRLSVRPEWYYQQGTM